MSGWFGSGKVKKSVEAASSAAAFEAAQADAAARAMRKAEKGKKKVFFQVDETRRQGRISYGVWPELQIA